MTTDDGIQGEIQQRSMTPTAADTPAKAAANMEEQNKKTFLVQVFHFDVPIKAMRILLQNFTKKSLEVKDSLVHLQIATIS